MPKTAKLGLGCLLMHPDVEKVEESALAREISKETGVSVKAVKKILAGNPRGVRVGDLLDVLSYFRQNKEGKCSRD